MPSQLLYLTSAYNSTSLQMLFHSGSPEQDFQAQKPLTKVDCGLQVRNIADSVQQISAIMLSPVGWTAQITALQRWTDACRLC